MDSASRCAISVLTLCLAACQGLEDPEETSTVDAKQSLIQFQHVDYDPDLAEYSVSRSTRSGNEVHTARLYGADAFAILGAYKTSAGYVVPDRPTESYIRDVLVDASLEWGESGRSASRLGQVPYRMFRIEDEPLDCVAFSQQVGETSDDLGRKSDLVFGFFCHDATRPMSAEAAEDLIGRVSFGRRR